VLLTQAFRKKFVIPDFVSFASEIDALYENAKNLGGGQVGEGEAPGSVRRHGGDDHFLIKCPWGMGSVVMLPFVLLRRWLTTFPSWPGSARTSGPCPYALWMDKGTAAIVMFNMQ
jgi:hypothetical protein